CSKRVCGEPQPGLGTVTKPDCSQLALMRVHPARADTQSRCHFADREQVDRPGADRRAGKLCQPSCDRVDELWLHPRQHLVLNLDCQSPAQRASTRLVEPLSAPTLGLRLSESADGTSLMEDKYSVRSSESRSSDAPRATPQLPKTPMTMLAD